MTISRQRRRTAGRVSARVAIGLIGAPVLTVVVPVSSQAVVVNGVQNGDLSAGAGNAFDCFANGGWGTSTRTLTAVTGRGNTGRAASLTLTNWASGDRKLLISQTTAARRR
ncbi:MAG: hypothetical protein U0R72_18595 [Nakamurella multipartita]